MFFITFFLFCLVLFVFHVQSLHRINRKAVVLTGSIKERKILLKYSQAPGPKPWPIIGNLNIMAIYRHNPFEGFSALALKYGDMYTLTLGYTRCIIVNSLVLIKEVLQQNGKYFGGRPNFIRYHKLFGGDRNNSLALCDWSQLQQKRRNLARRHCSPLEFSTYFQKMSTVACLEARNLIYKLEENVIPNTPFDIKPLIQQTCANMFFQYMCSIRYNYEDVEFQRIVSYFDNIFWEINQGYLFDFLPWLAPFYENYTKQIEHWSGTIRTFILDRIIKNREQNVDIDEPDNDFTDALLKSLHENNISRDTILFMLEDFIGGHSAVGNLVMLTLIYIAKYPHIVQRIRDEADAIAKDYQREINLDDIEAMPFTMATLYETLRFSSSPIVPHVATEDTVVAGYGIIAGTLVFFNNYMLNTSEKYWLQPKVFQPERFLEKQHKPRSTSPRGSDNKNTLFAIQYRQANLHWPKLGTWFRIHTLSQHCESFQYHYSRYEFN